MKRILLLIHADTTCSGWQHGIPSLPIQRWWGHRSGFFPFKFNGTGVLTELRSPEWNALCTPSHQGQSGGGCSPGSLTLAHSLHISAASSLLHTTHVTSSIPVHVSRCLALMLDPPMRLSSTALPCHLYTHLYRAAPSQYPPLTL